MKNLVAILLVSAALWLSASHASAQATTYTVTAHSFTMTNGTGGIARITSGKFYSNGSGGYGGVSGTYAVGASTAWSIAAGSFTDTVPFVVRFAWSRSGAIGPSYYWVSSVPAGSGQSSVGGPMNSTGTQYQNSAGGSTDPFAPTAPTRSYKWTKTIENTTANTQWFKFEILKKPSGTLFTTHNIMIAPGSTRTINFVYNFDFRVRYYLMTATSGSGGTSGVTYQPTGPALGIEDATNSTDDMPRTPDGELVFNPPSPSSNDAGGSIGGGSSSIEGTPGAVPNETRPGTQDGNDDARNKELRNEIARVGKIVENGTNKITGQLKENADRSDAKSDELKEKMDEIKEKMDDEAAKTDGGGDSGGEPGATPAGMMDFIGDLGDRSNRLGTAIGGLINAAGLNSQVTNASLIFNFTLFGHAISLDIERFANPIATLRLLMLWTLGIGALWQAFAIVRGAFVDQA